jgi:cobalamin biosynthetic protein CobC
MPNPPDSAAINRAAPGEPPVVNRSEPPVVNRAEPPVVNRGEPPVTDHGGNLAAARQTFPDAPEPWLDLSTGLNPWPWPWPAPLPPLPAQVWQRLPDDATLNRLVEAATLAYGAPGPDHGVAAPGSQALIQALPRLRPAGRVAVLGPTFAEHRRCWAAAGHAVTEPTPPPAPELADRLGDWDIADRLGDWDIADRLGDWDVVVVVNPNNPDGRRMPTDALLALAGRLAARGGWLVVDEAFADPTPETSLARHAGRPGLIVLRSFGKFFGLAGLRLGFALAEPSLIEALKAWLGPWPVNGPAVAVATAALADRAWSAATRSRLDAAAERLDRLLTDRGLTRVGGTALFRLVASPNAPALYRALGAAGILVRRFDAHPQWLRLGLPSDEPAWSRLAAALPS